MAQDRLLELLQRGTRVQAELLVERAPHVVVGRERLRLPAGAVEREHQLPAQALAQRVLRRERLELADELRRAATSEVRLDPALQRGEVELLEALRLPRCERLRELAQRRTAPQRERLAQASGGRARVTRRECRTPFPGEAQEAIQVERFRVELQHVAGRTSAEHVRRKHPPQQRHADLHHLRAAVGNVVAPEAVDQSLARDRAAGAEQQHRQQSARTTAGNGERLPVAKNLQRAEDPELHGPS